MTSHLQTTSTNEEGVGRGNTSTHPRRYDIFVGEVSQDHLPTQPFIFNFTQDLALA